MVLNRPKSICLGDRFQVIPSEDCPYPNQYQTLSRCNENTQEDEECFLEAATGGGPTTAPPVTAPTNPTGSDCVFPINEINSRKINNCGDEFIVQKLGSSSKSAKSA